MTDHAGYRGMEERTSGSPSDLLLGIDIGTTHCKVAVGNRGGEIVQRAAFPCRLDTPRQGWVEVDPEIGWWRPLLLGLKRVLATAGIDGGAIRGLAVSCTNGLVCLDKAGRPVRNAIMQIDRRTAAISRAIEETIGREEIRRITGNRVAPGSCSAPSLLWIRSKEPARFEEVDLILSPSGYVVHRLTGRRVMDRTRAATTLFYDIREGTWSEKMIRSLEIPDRMLPPILSPDEVAGEVTREAARLTGLKAGTPVTAGVMDSIAAAIGAGTTIPGQIGIVLGTVGRVLWPLAGPAFDDRFLNIPLVAPDRWMGIACTNGTGLSVDWFTANLMNPGGSPDGRDPLEIFDSEASASPPGSRGLIYLPYLAGERSPIWNPHARGVFFGLDRGHTRGDLARSVMEGTAFSIRRNLEILESVTGTRSGTIWLSGGGSRSPVWPDIISSVLKRELRISARGDSECAGAILLAAVGAGLLDREEVLDRRSPETGRRTSPALDLAELYDELFRRYTALSDALGPHFARFDEASRKGAAP